MKNLSIKLYLALLLAMAGCGLPTVMIKHNLPKDAWMTQIALACYTTPGESATFFVKSKIREKFPTGMARAQAESIGFECQGGTPVACRYSGVVVEEMVGAGKINFQDGSKKREVTINAEITDLSNLETLKFNSTATIIK